MRTRLSICMKKARFPSARDALLIAERSAPLILSPSERSHRQVNGPLRPYRCDRCRMFHLTSRTKGKRVPRPQSAAP
jgi:hypothetical protein